MIIYRIEKCEPNPASRHECAHKLLATMLSEYTDHSYAELKKDQNGRPYIDGVVFSISHCNDVAVVALSVFESKSEKDVVVADVSCASLGVDVEEVSCKSRERCEKVAVRKFFDSENALLSACEDENCYIEAFCELWTKKESYCKFTGVGLSDALGFDTQSVRNDVSLYTDFVAIGDKRYAVSLCYNSVQEI